MSTKIYDAYKVIGTRDPWSVVWSLQDQGRANVTNGLKDLYWDLMIHLDPSDPDYLKSQFKEDSWYNRLQYVMDLVRNRYKDQRESPYRDAYNFDIEIGVTPFENSLYLRAFCDTSSLLGKSLDFLKTHPNLRDYHYQNSTDRPKNISSREWNQRKKTWEAMMSSDTSVIRCVSLDICSKDSIHQLIPRMKEQVIPSLEEVYANDLVKVKFNKTHVEQGLIILEKNGKTYRIAFDGVNWRVRVDGKISKTPGSNPKPAKFLNLKDAASHVDYLGLPEAFKAIVDRMILRSERNTAY